MNKAQLREEITAYVIHHSAEGDDLDDLILNVCQISGCSWPRAERLVRQIQEEQGPAIAKRQLPIIYLAAFFILGGGLAFLGAGVYFILESILQHEGLFPADLYSYALHGLGQDNYPISAFQPAIYPYFKWILGFLFSPISMIVTGILMILGSLVGMRDLWVEILRR